MSEQIDNNNTICIGIEPHLQVLNGSPKVPFIYEDYIDKESVCNAILKMYNYNEEHEARWVMQVMENLYKPINTH